MRRMTIGVRKALESAQISDRDAAAVALIRRYAGLMDEPGIPTKYRKPLADLRTALAYGDGDGKGAEALATITAALSEQSVASDLGPKLLAGLTALGLTLAGRADKTTRETTNATPGRAAHDEIKARRESRKRATENMDAAT